MKNQITRLAVLFPSIFVLLMLILYGANAIYIIESRESLYQRILAERSALQEVHATIDNAEQLHIMANRIACYDTLQYASQNIIETGVSSSLSKGAIRATLGTGCLFVIHRPVPRPSLGPLGSPDRGLLQALSSFPSSFLILQIAMFSGAAGALIAGLHANRPRPLQQFGLGLSVGFLILIGVKGGQLLVFDTSGVVGEPINASAVAFLASLAGFNYPAALRMLSNAWNRSLSDDQDNPPSRP